MSRLQQAVLIIIAATSCARPPAPGANEAAPIVTALSPECVALHVVFRIRPDGRSDVPTLAIRGTTDPSYRQSVERFLSGARFRVPALRGCPVPSRGEFVIGGV
jgi:hypothetical protein